MLFIYIVLHFTGCRYVTFEHLIFGGIYVQVDKFCDGYPMYLYKGSKNYSFMKNEVGNWVFVYTSVECSMSINALYSGPSGSTPEGGWDIQGLTRYNDILCRGKLHVTVFSLTVI